MTPRNIVISGATSGIALGRAAYSFQDVVRRFAAYLTRQSIDHVYCASAEIYGNAVAFESLRSKFRDPSLEMTHVCHAPFEKLRLLPGVKNVAWVAWEFDALVSEGADGDVFFASRFDEVWVSSQFARDVLVRRGLRNVKVVPVPVPSFAAKEELLDFLGVKALPYSSVDPHSVVRLSDVVRREDRFFLSILNPWDYRKNIVNLINSFGRAELGANVKLIIKATIDNQATSLVNLNDVVAELSKNLGIALKERENRNIIFIADHFTDGQLKTLLSRSLAYCCVPHCEGFNLPLADAIAAGKAAITTRNTAMLDYIPASYPLAVKCTRAALPPYVKSLYGFKSDVNWFEYNEDALAVAFRKVVRGEAGVLGLDKMSEAFSDDAVTAAIR